MKDNRYDELCRAAGDVSRETFERLELFERRFIEWNHHINLTSATNLDQLWTRHIVDSAQLLRLGGHRYREWLDFGSGGGFPGAIVAIMLADHGGNHVHLVESNRKKAAFLTRIVSETGAQATVHAVRIEKLHGKLDQIGVLTARAVAKLNRLLHLARPWLMSDATAFFQKGREYKRELEDCRDDWIFDLIEHESRTDPAGVILEISNLRTT